MKNVLNVIFAAVVLVLIIGCGLDFDDDSGIAKISGNGNSDNELYLTSDSNRALIDLKVRLGWARAERFKIVGTKGYHSLFGIVRVEIVSNRNQNVIIHYSTNGAEWSQVYAKDNGLTDDGQFKKFYFYTPALALETNRVSKVVYQFKVEYQVDGETNVMSDGGRIFKASSNPGKSLPNGVIGQGAPGYWHILLENAEMISFTNTNTGSLVSNLFHGHIQVKNEGPNAAKEVKIVYRMNMTGWSEQYIYRYPSGLAFKTDKSFYSNGYKYGIEHWEFNLPMPTNTQYVQFILQVKYSGTGDLWDDKNRCKRYWIKTVPGIMTSYATN